MITLTTQTHNLVLIHSEDSNNPNAGQMEGDLNWILNKQMFGSTLPYFSFHIPIQPPTVFIFSSWEICFSLNTARKAVPPTVWLTGGVWEHHRHSMESRASKVHSWPWNNSRTSRTSRPWRCHFKSIYLPLNHRCSFWRSFCSVPKRWRFS